MTLPTATKALRQVFEGLGGASRTCRNRTSHADGTVACDADRQADRVGDFVKMVSYVVPQTETRRTIVVGMISVVEGEARQDC
jgi:hypothetical protein